jgi:hypothetical protein
LISCDLQLDIRILAWKREHELIVHFLYNPYSIVKEALGVGALKTEQERQQRRTLL